MPPGDSLGSVSVISTIISPGEKFISRRKKNKRKEIEGIISKF
jgi:hypothetical protein